MKTFKKAFLIAGVISTGMTQAQSSEMNHMLKLGINGGVATGKVASANVGANISYQYIVRPGLGIGIATGYNHFFGKETKATENNITYTINNNDLGVIPIAATIRVYPKKTGFYLGADFGYGIIVGNKNVADKVKKEHPLFKPTEEKLAVERPNGGVYLKPEIGWHNRDWNFYIHYTKVFTGDKGDLYLPLSKNKLQNYNIGSFGVGVNYNIPFGK